MKDLDLIKKLLALLNETNAGSIEVRKNLWSTTIRVSKNASLGNSGPATYHVTAPAAGNPAPAQAPHAAAPLAEQAGSGKGKAAVETAHLTEVKSPMVGTFYAQPEPGAEPYVQVGTRIAPGQTLCVIEAMKIMNPIDAELSGVVKEIAVQDTQPVEFGQVLFRVDPNG
jgi:acetyl-CoA carboxylase biotin carboxyl carrier protein